MNQDTENNRPGDESDPLVSASYRATATERTPPALDAAVLKKAEAAPRDIGLRRFTAFWFRPLAFVATLGLSLALLLELNRSPESQSIATPDIEFGHSKAQSKLADPPPAVIGVTSEDDRTDSPTNMSGPTRSKNPIVETGRLESAPAPATDPVGTVETSADFAEMIEASSMQIQKQQRVAEITTQGLAQTRPEEKEQVREVAAFRASAFMLEEAARACTNEQISVPATWWQCISDLEEDGRHDEAKAELELFNKANPDFEAPVFLPSQ